ncbi:MAG: class I SAM-dependent methyltransferase [Dehalococcoidia bacterium]
MPRGWQWDATLFQGAAEYYERGRIPYPPGLADAIATALQLDGRGRLIDVGCGPGVVALRLAHLFEAVVGLDPDADMLAEAARRAADLGIGNARWVRALAEDLPARLGSFRVATFAQSFHWMKRERVAAVVFAMLEPGGAFVQVSGGRTLDLDPLPHPRPPRDAIEALQRRYLGPVRRAGQGVLLYGTPSGEDAVVTAAGFGPIEVVRVEGRQILVRTIDDLVAGEFSNSASAPHLFGGRLAAFEADLRALLADASPSGLFAEQSSDAEVRMWRKPQG